VTSAGVETKSGWPIDGVSFVREDEQPIRFVSRRPARVAAPALREWDDIPGDRGSQGARRCTNRSDDQPDCAFAHLDRKRLQWDGAGRCLNDARQRLKRALGTPHHLARADVVARGVPWALQASVVCHLPVAQRSEQVAAAVGQRERLARADANG
jgi:hypothetical protein